MGQRVHLSSAFESVLSRLTATHRRTNWHMCKPRPHGIEFVRADFRNMPVFSWCAMHALCADSLPSMAHQINYSRHYERRPYGMHWAQSSPHATQHSFLCARFCSDILTANTGHQRSSHSLHQPGTSQADRVTILQLDRPQQRTHQPDAIHVHKYCRDRTCLLQSAIPIHNRIGLSAVVRCERQRLRRLPQPRVADNPTTKVASRR